jgi:hypothetical protein
MPKVPFRRRKPLSKRIAAKIAEARAEATEHIESTASNLAGQASAGFHAAAQRLPSPPVDRERVSQEAHDVAQLAATTALDLWERARTRSANVREALPSRDQLSEQLGAAAATLDKRAHEAEKVVQERAASARKRAKSIEPAIEERVVAAKDRGAEVAEEAAKTGKSVFSLMLWLGAAIAAIYFLLFNRERREKIWSMTKEVTAEARDIVNDLRGYDGEFANPT